MTDGNPPRRFSKGDFYKLCREWHGYLSALAFIALIFFAATGLLLNHPGLLGGGAAEPVERAFKLDAAQIAAVRAAPVPGEALAKIAATKVGLAGAYSDGDVSGDDVFVRLQGVRGTSDVRGNLATGEVSVYVERAPAVGVLNELHRGERAGAAWRFAIDVIAALLIVTSLIGFVLFLSLRFRLRTSLVLMGLSAIVLIGLFVIVVP
ncbi:MAG TPA: PepSY-associated TM helix domain-containing protein [Hyphomonadaceae bacterium]|jgi:hypothetical protein|nr:PepSY-associated TM helix domain-containing protein [Hyphomonadaceae bacterium]